MADPPLRGEIWIVDLGHPVGHESADQRPALVVSDDPSNRHGLVVVCPIGSARRDYPSRIEVDPGRSGLDHPSFAQGEQVRTISARRLVARLGNADITVMIEVERVLRLLLRL